MKPNKAIYYNEEFNKLYLVDLSKPDSYVEVLALNKDGLFSVAETSTLYTWYKITITAAEFMVFMVKPKDSKLELIDQYEDYAA